MFRKLREAKNEEGFTLIELLVVVLIIGILAAIAIPVFLDQRQKAYRDAASADARNLALIMEDYASDNNGVYTTDIGLPGSGSDIEFQPSDGVTAQAFVDTTTPLAGFCLYTHHAAFNDGTNPTESWAYNAQGDVTNAVVEHQDPAVANAGCSGTGGGTVTGN